MAEATAQCG